ncbi:MAG TPA: hypothetical protein VLA41_11980 [Burkholderiales bacterium]|nr:hypothetical protein [Burkholderiales bacterium]
MSWPTVRRVAAAFAGLLVAASAAAQLRTIPVTAERGVMSHVSGMMVSLNGERLLLATGAQIRDTSNRIILPTTLPPDSRVKYTLDVQGQVHRVWILSPAEAAQPDPNK